jgi:hypothetical protein
MIPEIHQDPQISSPPERKAARRTPRAILRRVRHALEQRGASVKSLLIVAIVGFAGSTQVFSNVLSVLVLLGIVLYEFQKRIDQGLPLMQMAAMMGVMQWTLGPLLAFRSSLLDGRYAMYVDEATYFSYALPGAAAYVFGLLAVGSSIRQREILRFVRRDHFMTIGWVLSGIALAGRLAAPSVPGGLAFAVHLLSQLGYVGTLYFLFSRSTHRWIWVVISLVPLFKTTGESAMFHDLILWMGLLFCYWYGMRKRDPLPKAGFLLGAALILFTIQAVKQDYRAKVWNGQDASLVQQAAEFWTSDEPATRDEIMANVITRLNQGWIISAVLRHVPDEEPYANGETLENAVSAAFLPRILAGNKAKAGGQTNFRRFTGLDLADSTSMAISPLGEAYANFGRVGGIALMLGFGLAFASFYAFCLRHSVIHPTFLFWVPMIFYQAIKAETEFVTVLNQVTKGSIVAFGLYWLIDTKFFPSALRKPKVLKKLKEPRAARRSATAG